MPEKKQYKLSEYDETIRIVLESGGEFRMYPRGTSMLPLLVQGRDSVVLVRPERSPEKGDIAFYLREGGAYVLHRIVGREGDLYTMCGDNQLQREQGIRREQIIAVVDRVYRGQRCIRRDHVPYRIYCFLWRSFLIRRIFFKLRGQAKKFAGCKGFVIY